jgi:hypothetical protein
MTADSDVFSWLSLPLPDNLRPTEPDLTEIDKAFAVLGRMLQLCQRPDPDDEILAAYRRARDELRGLCSLLAMRLDLSIGLRNPGHWHIAVMGGYLRRAGFTSDALRNISQCLVGSPEIVYPLPAELPEAVWQRIAGRLVEGLIWCASAENHVDGVATTPYFRVKFAQLYFDLVNCARYHPDLRTEREVTRDEHLMWEIILYRWIFSGIRLPA